MKITGVVAYTYRDYKLWCKERRIIPVNLSNGLCTDKEGEMYTPVLNLDHIGGRQFADVEATELAKEFRKDLIKEAKKRIR
jgi:hypothetical protein